MRVLPTRLLPGTGLRLALDQLLLEQDEEAGCVISGIGSLSVACLRLAGREEVTSLEGELEILSLAGFLSPDGAHLHISVADADGRVIGEGHLCRGSLVRTTAELLVGLLPECRSAGSWIVIAAIGSCRSGPGSGPSQQPLGRRKEHPSQRLGTEVVHFPARNQHFR